ncbi:protein SICKLE-like [Henckelia pumila]|uniref:protein SICKLE-like n=1 Tax=Henckelia pumila TaxID=405737 RepID=UPI003C6E3FA5
MARKAEFGSSHKQIPQDMTSAPIKAAGPLGNVSSIWGGSNTHLNYSYMPNTSAYDSLPISGFRQVDSSHAIHGWGRGSRHGNIPHPQLYYHYEFGRGNGHYPNSRRGMGGGHFSAGGRRRKDSDDPVSAELRPDLYYDEEMLEDPWKGMTPVKWEGPSSGNSRLLKSTSVKKAKTSSEGAHKSISQPSLAEYLATSFNENVDGPET